MSDNPPGPYLRGRVSAAALIAATLFLGACTTASDSGSESGDQVEADAGQGTDSGANEEGSGAADPVDEPETEIAEPTDEGDEEVVEEPPGPEPVTLALQPDPIGSTDPRETILHLPQVDVTDSPDGIFITFPDQQNGAIMIELVDPMNGSNVRCLDLPEESGAVATLCTVNGPNGEYTEEVLGAVEGTGPNTIRVPLTYDGDYVILTVAGTAYMAQRATFADSPPMVQIDPGSGGLAQDVTSAVGVISAVDLAAQLG